MGLFFYVINGLRRRPARAVALVLGVLVATSSFVVWTSAVRSSRPRPRE